jgi:hypothetical protein
MTDGIYFNSHSDLRQFGIRLQEKDQQLQQERKAREQAEWERDRLREERNELQKRLDNFVRDCGTTMFTCPGCGHGMSSRTGCLYCQRDKLRRERNHLLQLAYDIFDTLPAMEQGGPCPVCWTYTHKSWCYYERLKKAVEEME